MVAREAHPGVADRSPRSPHWRPAPPRCPLALAHRRHPAASASVSSPSRPSIVYCVGWAIC